MNIRIAVIAAQARKAIQQTSGQLSQLGTAAATAGRGAGGMTGGIDGSMRSLGKWGSQVQWAGRQLQYNFTAPILLAGAAATKWALDQDKAMTRVRKVYGDTSISDFADRELGALEKAFTALSNKYGVAIDETTNIAAEWAAAGASGLALANDVELTMRTMVLGELEAADATEALVAIQAQYGFTSKELGTTLNELNNIENQTGTTMGDLIISMSKASGVARNMGVDARHLAAMTAALVPAAGSASQAGNALKTILQRLFSPTKEAAQVLDKMGISMTDANWVTANGTARLEILSKAYGGLSDAQKAVVATTTAGIYQSNKAQVLLEALANKQSYYNKALEASADENENARIAEKELNAVLDSNAQKTKQVGVIIQNSMVKVIQPLLPLIIGMATWIGNLATKISNMNPATLKFIGVALFLLAALGILARYIGAMATMLSILGRTFTWLGKPIMGALRFFGLFRAGAVAQTAATQATVVAQTAAGTSRVGALWALLKLRILAQLSHLKLLALVQWMTMWGAFKGVMAAQITRLQALLTATMTPAFIDSMMNLRAALWARWAVTWSYLTAPVVAAWTRVIGFLTAQKASLIAWATLGGTMSVWRAAWIRMLLIAGITSSAMMTRLKAFGAPFVAMWGAIGTAASTLWTKLRFAFVAVEWTVGSALMAGGRAIAAPFVAMWALIGTTAKNVWTKLRFAFAAIDWAIGPVLLGAARAIAGPLVAAWSLIARAMTAVWSGLTLALRVIWVNGTMLLRLLVIQGGMLISNAWAAVTGFFGRIWSAVLFSMRVMWMSFVAFIQAPGALIGAFKKMGSIVAAGGRGIMTILGVMRTGIMALLTSPWAWAVLAVIAILMLFRKQIEQVWTNIKNYFSNANNGIVKAFDALPNGIKGAFLKVIAFVKAAAQKIGEWLSYLNPFAKHSPSLVDNVTAGLAVVRAQYGTLTQIAGPIGTAYAQIKKLKDVSASLRQGAASIALAKDIEELSKTAPQVVPAFRELSNTLTVLKGKQDALETAINDQEQTTNAWQQAVDDASDALDRQKDILDRLQETADGYKDQIDALNESTQTLVSTPIQGLGRMEDAIFANQMAQKKLQLQIMGMEDAGQTYDDIKSKIADLSGEIESLRGTQNDLRAAGAGSEILGFYDDQINALETQQRAMDKQAAPIQAATNALNDLQREADRMDLQKSLKFDPLTRQIEQAANTMKELPFNEIIGGIQRNQAAIGPLETAYNQANAAITRQEAAVKAAEAVHAQMQAGYDVENTKLQVLKDSYSQVSDAVSDVSQALSDMKTAADAANEAGKSTALTNFENAAGGNFAEVGGAGGIGREAAPLGGMGDQTADIENFTKGIEDELGKSFGGLDMFGPFKDMWNKGKQWLIDNLGPFFQPVKDFFATAFEGVDFDLGSISDKLGGAFDIDWTAIGTKIEDAFHDIWMTVFDIGSLAWDLLGPDFQETIDIVWNWLKGFWDDLTGLFGGGSGVLDSVVSAFKAFWNVMRPIATFVGEYLVAAIHILWSALNGALGPVLDGIKNIALGLWGVLKGVFDVITGIFTLDFGKIWSGIKGILGGLGQIIWGFLEGIFGGILGFLWGWVKGVWDIGVNIVSGIWGGIEGAWNGFTSWLGGLWDGFIQFIKNILGIASPSSIFAEIGGWLIDGLLNGLNAAWEGVKTFFTDFLPTILGKIGDIASSLWQKGLDLIGGLASGIWQAIEDVWWWAVNFSDTIEAKIGDVVSTLWQKGADIIQGLWDGIVNIADQVWTWIKDTPNRVKNNLEATGKVAVWLYDKGKAILQGMWDGIVFIADQVWTWIKDTPNRVKNNLEATGKVAVWLYDKGKDIITGMWDGIKNVATNVFQWFKDLPGKLLSWMGNVGKTLWQIGVDILNSFGNGINSAWETIKEKAKAPIQWVVDIVWNNGLRALWNTMNDLWGGTDLNPFVFAAAKGGVLPGHTPGRDVHRFVSRTGGVLDLSGGEAVMRPEFTDALGKEGVNLLNQIARLQGPEGVRNFLASQSAQFTNGGIINLPGWLDSILTFVPGGGTIKDIVDSINGSSLMQGTFGELIGIPKKVAGAIWDKVKAWWDDDSGPKTGGGVTAAGGGSQIQRMFATIQKAFPRARLNEGYSPRPGYHGRGKATDLGEQGFSGGAGRPMLADMKKWIYSSVANVAELIYDGLGNRVADIKNSQDHTYDATTRAQHANHVHWAMDTFDRGGILDGLGLNSSGSPERVLTPRQTQAFDRLVTMLDTGGMVTSLDALEGVIFRATVRANAAENIGNQTIVNGDMGTTNITNNFYGDLSFPNITDPDDADTFLQNLSDLAGGGRR